MGPAPRVVADVGEPGELLGDDAAGDVATVVAAHPVGHHEHRWLGQVGVLVHLAHEPDVGGHAVVELDLVDAGSDEYAAAHEVLAVRGVRGLLERRRPGCRGDRRVG